MEIISNIALISINETVIAQLISFLIFVFIINRVMFRPLRQTIADREALIDKLAKNIDTSKLELETVTAQAIEREAALKQDALKIKKDLESAADRESSLVLSATGKELTAIQEKTEQDVANMISAARNNIAEESKTLTVSIMEKLLDRRLAS